METFEKLLLTVLILFSFHMFFACAAKRTTPCSPAGDSVLCSVAGALGTTPEAISKIVTVQNIVALEKDFYTAEQANAYVKELISAVTLAREVREVSLQDVIEYTMQKYLDLPKEVQLCFILLDPGDIPETTITLLLTDYDYDLILDTLAKQQSVIAIYSPKEWTQ